MRGKVYSETVQIVRPICTFLLAATAAACAMIAMGKAPMAMLLPALIVLTGALLVIQVYRAASGLSRRSTTIAQAACHAERHYVDVLRRIISFVESREPYMHDHSRRVAQLAEQIARRIGLDGQTCSLLKLAGELHDIGMLAVPPEVLRQRCRLGGEAFRSIKRHPLISYEVLKPLESLGPVLPAILHHHERMNGSGYPSEIRGQDIPIGARILAVADSYDAMTHDRPHRPAMLPQAAMAELKRCTPAGYDGECVEALASVLNLPTLQTATA